MQMSMSESVVVGASVVMISVLTRIVAEGRREGQCAADFGADIEVRLEAGEREVEGAPDIPEGHRLVPRSAADWNSRTGADGTRRPGGEAGAGASGRCRRAGFVRGAGGLRFCGGAVLRLWRVVEGRGEPLLAVQGLSVGLPQRKVEVAVPVGIGRVWQATGGEALRRLRSRVRFSWSSPGLGAGAVAGTASGSVGGRGRWWHWRLPSGSLLERESGQAESLSSLPVVASGLRVLVGISDGGRRIG
jgi:hypothetical protein